MVPTVAGEPAGIAELVQRVSDEGVVLLTTPGGSVVCLPFEEFVRLLGSASASYPSQSTSPATALSVRETEVLSHISKGLSATETSMALGVSLNTTNQHLLSVRRKFGVRSTREAVRRWLLCEPQASAGEATGVGSDEPVA